MIYCFGFALKRYHSVKILIELKDMNT